MSYNSLKVNKDINDIKLELNNIISRSRRCKDDLVDIVKIKETDAFNNRYYNKFGIIFPQDNRLAYNYVYLYYNDTFLAELPYESLELEYIKQNSLETALLFLKSIEGNELQDSITI